MRMAYPESCFQASNAHECAAAIQEWASPSHATNEISLRSAVQHLCRADLSSDVHRGIATLGPLNLFVIISGR
jgi:hypothetical protein